MHSFSNSARIHAVEELATTSARLAQYLNLDPSVSLRSPNGNIQPIILVDTSLGTEALITQAIARRSELYARAAEIAEARTHVRQERLRPFLPTIWGGFSAGQFGGE